MVYVSLSSSFFISLAVFEPLPMDGNSVIVEAERNGAFVDPIFDGERSKLGKTTPQE